MGGSKYNRILGNKFIIKYKNSLAFISSTNRLSKIKQEKYNYLQDSIIPTYHFQKSLTKLAIPKLDDTVSRYLTALKPLLNENEMKKAEEITKNFQANEAPLLDKEIRELDARDKHGNYISEPWFDMYLRARESIVLNYNPFIIFKPDPNLAQMNQAVRAANFLISSARFLNSLRSNKLKPEIFHLNPEKSDTLFFQRLMRLIPEAVSFYGAYMFNAYPLDMSQYYRLFNSTRIPKKDKDVLFTDESKKHVVIIHRGHFFTFPLFDQEGNILKSEEILGCVKYILNLNLKEAELPVGVLTAENRDIWAGARARLEQLGNQEALNAIDSALYCMALDDFESDDQDQLSANFLHGDPKNRWFDKNYTLILSKNGHTAINFEHSWGDGVAVIRLFNELFDDTTKNAYVNSKTIASCNKGDLSQIVRKLEFKLDDNLKEGITKAIKNYQVATSQVKLKNFELYKFGKSSVKKFGISPDSLMQSGFQVAYFNVFNKIPATYESASTSAFKLGRTETIRPVTMATKRLAEYLKNHKDSENYNEIVTLMKDCSKTHNQLVKEGAMGQGFDRHLFALKYHALNRKKMEKLPEFFGSHAYKFINHNTLSTSTLAYDSILTGGFAPVVPDGFGIGYRILENSLGASVSYYGNQEELKRFVAELQETYERFHKILKHSSVKKDSKK